MKKLIAIALFVISFTSFAQQGNRLSPEQQTDLQVKKMTLELNLNSKQQNKIKPILLENNKEKEERYQKIQQSRKSGERLSTDERYKMKDEMLDSRIEVKEKLSKVLTPEQLAKWEESQRQNSAPRGMNRKNQTN
ncbi:Spy/CpxP family protein refolding chaperone [Flavobacterium chuncheonense]|uniref:Spy/CpxP family protein refolding chaperone n=1 Tax=Flavobacterium chuncheonense TaxID=2026653 RepID=A0ABW5YLN1_9FLAO